MVDHRSTTYIPPLVKRALNLAEQMNYSGSCSNETGRLLGLLTSQFQSGVIGEIATGCGVSAAWIVSSLSPSTSFYSVEADDTRAAAAGALFDTLLNVRVIHNDWRDFIKNWRFNMLYASFSSSRAEAPEVLLDSLSRGSLIVMDGMPVRNRVTLKVNKEAEEVRQFWLNDPHLMATEIQVSSRESVILATRVSG